MEQKNFRKFGIRDQVGYFFGDLAGSMVNLYIGGCSLERHWGNIQADETAYLYELNGESE